MTHLPEKLHQTLKVAACLLWGDWDLDAVTKPAIHQEGAALAAHQPWQYGGNDAAPALTSGPLLARPLDHRHAIEPLLKGIVIRMLFHVHILL
ncbi:hypothetical protein ATO50_00485 [Aeromonas hydrophila]|nr:hypothetical protein ATO50_00485 [Aeromonas hydrophila]